MSADALARPTDAPAAAADVRLFIGGRWRAGGAGTREIVDPATEGSIGAVQLASDADLDDALAAAAAAFPAWSELVPARRGEVLKRASALLAGRLDEAAATLCREGGKTLAEARAEITRAIDTLAWNGEEAGRIEGRLIAGAVPGSERLSVPVPLGVVAAFTAWNFPAVLGARKLGAALAAGCTVVLKAAETTPGTAAIIVECLAAAGLPAGAANLVFGDPAHVSRHLLGSPVVKALTFTGSTAVGRILAGLAAPNLTRCVLELGGHAPVIVCEDADVDHAVATSSPAKFGSAGQSCVAPSRYFVHRSRYDAFAARITETARAIRVGPGDEPGVTMGPLANRGRLEAMERLTADAVARGARLLTGGRRIGDVGFFFEPTVLGDVSRDAAIMTEEPFGPIVSLIPYDDFETMLDQANETDYGFAAYLFTDSIARRDRALRRLQAGNIGINQMAPSLPDAPLGGVKGSGSGYEGGREGVESFLQFRLVSQSAGPGR